MYLTFLPYWSSVSAVSCTGAISTSSVHTQLLPKASFLFFLSNLFLFCFFVVLSLFSWTQALIEGVPPQVQHAGQSRAPMVGGGGASPLSPLPPAAVPDGVESDMDGFVELDFVLAGWPLQAEAVACAVPAARAPVCAPVPRPSARARTPPPPPPTQALPPSSVEAPVHSVQWTAAVLALAQQIQQDPALRAIAEHRVAATVCHCTGSTPALDCSVCQGYLADARKQHRTHQQRSQQRRREQRQQRRTAPTGQAQQQRRQRAPPRQFSAQTQACLAYVQKRAATTARTRLHRQRRRGVVAR